MTDKIETLEQYEELKALYMQYIATDRRLKKVLNKSPKKFIKYMNKNFVVCERWACVVEDLEEQSTFISAKETKEQAEKLANSFRAINKTTLIVSVKLNKYLKLK